MPTKPAALLALGLALVAATPSQGADAWPAAPIHYVIYAGPGGSPDVLARTLAAFLEPRLDVPVVVENRTGGAGNLARQYIVKSPADGYTLFGLTGTESINALLFPDLPFAPDFFDPVVAAVGSQQVLAVNPEFAAQTVQELIELARANPGTISLASSSYGTPGQLGVMLLQEVAEVSFNPVVYRNATAAMPDVVAGHADAILVTLSAALPFIREGSLRALAVTTPERAAALPEVPTFAESGYPTFAWTDWQGFAVAKGTPPEIIERLNREVNEILKDPAAIERLTGAGFEILGGPVQVAIDGLASDEERWGRIVTEYNIKAE